MRPSGRASDQLREVSLEPGLRPSAEGSCLIRCGNTHVLCTATVQERVPPFLRNSGRGWVTAEYGMLPRATNRRTDREAARGRQSGRTQEIQRLIGRSLRAVTELTPMGERQIVLDCDVLRADGGTRTAAITGAYVALHQAFAGLVAAGELPRLPLREPVAAVACGLVEGQARARSRLRRGQRRRGRRQLRADRLGRDRRDPGHRRGAPLTADQFVAMHRLAGTACASCCACSARRSAWSPEGGPALQGTAPRPGEPQPRQARRAAGAACAPWRRGHLEPRSRPAGAGRETADLRRQRPDQGACGGAGDRPAGARRRFRPRGARARRRARGAFGALGRAGARLRQGHGAGARRAERALRQRSSAADRRAAFVAALCLAWPDGHDELAEGRVEGELVDPPRGAGFGYDPMFVPEGQGHTFGEMPAADKQSAATAPARSAGCWRCASSSPERRVGSVQGGDLVDEPAWAADR